MTNIHNSPVMGAKMLKLMEKIEGGCSASPQGFLTSMDSPKFWKAATKSTTASRSAVMVIGAAAMWAPVVLSFCSQIILASSHSQSCQLYI